MLTGYWGPRAPAGFITLATSDNNVGGNVLFQFDSKGSSSHLLGVKHKNDDICQLRKNNKKNFSWKKNNHWSHTVFAFKKLALLHIKTNVFLLILLLLTSPWNFTASYRKWLEKKGWESGWTYRLGALALYLGTALTHLLESYCVILL